MCMQHIRYFITHLIPCQINASSCKEIRAMCPWFEQRADQVLISYADYQVLISYADYSIHANS